MTTIVIRCKVCHALLGSFFHHCPMCKNLKSLVLSTIEHDSNIRAGGINYVSQAEVHA